MKKNKLWITVSLIVGLFAIIYIGGSVYYQHHFLPKTTVLGATIAGKNVNQADKLLSEKIKTAKFSLTENGKTVLTEKQETVGIQQNFSNTLKKIMSTQNAWAWPAHLLGVSSSKIPNSKALVNETVLQQFADKTANSLNGNRKASTDANLTFKDGKVVATKETQGNKVETAKLVTAIKKSVDQNQTTVNLKSTYNKPALTENSAQFKKLDTQMKKIASVKGTLKIYNDTKVDVSSAEITSWVKIDNGNVSLDKDKVDAYLDKLDTKYATYGSTRQFNSTKRGTVSVSGGLYGWTINEASEVKQLSSDITAGKSFDRWITTKGSGYNKNGSSDIGDTYVEVDIQNQHEYYYKNGSLVLDSDVVTGKPSNGHDTPTGTYSVWSKQQDYTLRGQNDNGGDYASKVSYWMPIDDTGVGLHDSSWQPQYGGDWYKTHGSHGCVNNPPEFMAKLYNAVALGTPVVVF